MSQLDLIRADPALTYLGGYRIPGDPVPADRVAVRAGRFAKVRWRDGYERWRDTAATLLRGWASAELGLDAPLAVPVVLELRFLLARPRRAPTYTVRGRRWHYPLPWTDDRRPHLVRPDVDNLSKGPTDALVVAGVLEDDRWVWRLSAFKHYTAAGERPATELRLWRYDEEG